MIGFFLIGIALGMGYMEGLFWTIRYLNRFQRPMRFLAITTLIRFGIAGMVFYQLIQTGIWYSIFCALAGFLLVRTIWLWQEKKVK
ncbi:MAG: ATP synthase subunit I [Alphaproteobacteria bacterium]|nr:ATP synthase subunit I [Alphaproteobacteria bacterium]